METHPPIRIETERLVIRAWQPEDAPLYRSALDMSLEHLRPWLPWAHAEPSSLEETEERLGVLHQKFLDGEDFVYGIFIADETEVLGGTGLHPRVGPGGFDIGYWIRADRTGQGFATEAARALTRAGLGLEGIDRIQILCDPNNFISRRIPERLGYRLIETRRDDQVTGDGESRDTLVFEMSREDFENAEA